MKKKTRSRISVPLPVVTDGTGDPVVGELRVGGFGHWFFRLLAAIDREGSLIAGAREANLSYKGAWDMLEKAGSYSPRPLIERNPGGGHARGTRLTDAGRAVLELYVDFSSEFEGFLDTLNQRIGDSPLALQWLKGLRLRSSSRNQWPAEVVSLNLGSVAASVKLRLPHGTLMSVRLTRASAEALCLQHGDSVVLLLKSSGVILAAADTSCSSSEENWFRGEVSAVERAETGPEVEVAVRLDTGEAVVAMLTQKEFDALGVGVGQCLTVLIDSGSLIVAARPGSNDLEPKHEQ